MTALTRAEAWLLAEKSRIEDNIRLIEDGIARFSSSHDGGPLVDVTDISLADNKRKLEELNELLAQIRS